MNNDNFVFRFTPEQIDSLLDDTDLIEKGYEFSFAVDTYDLISYCLPYTGNISSSLRDKNLFAQRVIAYSDFFKANSDKSYICIEYQDELNKVTDRLSDNQARFLAELGENIDSIIDLFGKEGEDSKDNLGEKVRKNLELVITLLILDKEHSKYTKERRLFVKDNFRKIKSEIKNYIGEDKILGEFGDVAEMLPFVGIVFRSFVDEMASEIMDKDSRTSRLHYLETTYTDIQVICKLIQVNRSLEAGKSKKIVTYLSSVPRKSQQIFKILDRISGEGIGLPSISGYNKFNFHRNILQIFLLRKLFEKFPGEFVTIKNILTVIKKILQSKRSGRQKNEEKNDKGPWELEQNEIDDYNNVMNSLKDISIDIENHFYYDILRDLTAIPEGDNPGDGKMQLIEQAILLIRQEESALSDVSFLLKSLSRYAVAQTLINWFHQLKVSDIEVRIYKGGDIIRNPFVNLPYLVFLTLPESEVSSELHKVGFLVSTAKNLSANKWEIMEAFRRMFRIINTTSDDKDKQIEATVVISWLNLIAGPKGQKDNSINLSETFGLESTILLLLHRMVNIHETTDSYSPEADKGTETKGKMNVDLGYLLLWLLRRNLRFSECRYFGSKLIEQYPDDPRVFHGLALCVIAEFYHEKQLQKDFMDNTDEANTSDKLPKEAIEYLNRAVQKYRALSDTKHNYHLNRLVKNSILGVLNSKTDMCIRQYIIGKDFAILKTGRDSLDEMKREFLDAEISYDQYPIPNFTEAELEYQEAKYHMKNKDLARASVKILHATNRAYLVKEMDTDMDARFKEVVAHIDKLRIQIFREMKIV